MAMEHRFLPLACATALFAVAGCFNEPEPASKTVPKEARVYLSDKALKALPKDAFRDPAVVDYVNLDRNQFETFPAELATLKGLKWLRLNDNRLSSLPSLASLTSLRRIYLKNNRFKEVPAALKDLPALTDIDLSGNQIKEVPAWLTAKKGLENVSFSRTQVTRLPADLSGWTSLKSLQLGDLQIDAKEMARIRAALPKTAVVF